MMIRIWWRAPGNSPPGTVPNEEPREVPVNTGARPNPNPNTGNTMNGQDKWRRLLAALLLAALPGFARIGDNVIHPAYEMKTIPMPALYKSMGLGFLPDGRMVLATGYVEDGRTTPGDESNIWAVSGVTGSYMSNITMTRLGTRFINPSRVVIVDGTIYAPYSGSIKGGGPSDVPASSPYSGAFLKWDLAGNIEEFAGGLRSPNGANIDANGEMFVSDNQGSWLPSSTFAHMKQGRFYGHRQSPKRDEQGNITQTFAPNWAEGLPYQPPTAWLPHGTVRSSPGQPVFIPKGAYAGQWLQGDCNGTGLLRISLDKVDGGVLRHQAMAICPRGGLRRRQGAGGEPRRHVGPGLRGREDRNPAGQRIEDRPPHLLQADRHQKLNRSGAFRQ